MRQIMAQLTASHSKQPVHRVEKQCTTDKEFSSGQISLQLWHSNPLYRFTPQAPHVTSIALHHPNR